MSQPTPEKELADVVVAQDTQDRPFVPWHVTLRPWLFCLAFLLLAELVTRLYFDTSLCLQTERFDNFPTPALENAFVAQMRRDTAYKVVVIGDSTVVGSALLSKSQTTPRYLEQTLQTLLPNRKIHVWNFSLAGSRALDQLLLLEKALEGKPDFIVLEGNYYITSLGVEEHPLAEPWLAETLQTVPASIQPYLPPKGDAKKRFEDALTKGMEENVRFLGLRQAINAKLFGVQPRLPFGDPNPFVMTGVHVAKKLRQMDMKPWDQRGQTLTGYLYHYRRSFTADDLNCQFYREMTRRVSATGVPCLAYLTPQNPTITDFCMPQSTYLAGRKILADSLSAPGVPCRDYSGLVPQELFHDNDHMLPDGNQMLARALARDIAPRIEDVARTEKPSVRVVERPASRGSRP